MDQKEDISEPRSSGCARGTGLDGAGSDNELVDSDDLSDTDSESEWAGDGTQITHV